MIWHVFHYYDDHTLNKELQTTYGNEVRMFLAYEGLDELTCAWLMEFACHREGMVWTRCEEGYVGLKCGLSA